MIKGVAFDLEGTLIDVERAHHEGHLRAAAEVGVRLTLEEALARLPHFIGGPDEAVAQEIWELSDRSSSPARILDRTRHHYAVVLPELPIVLRPGVHEVLTALAQSGIPLAVGSLTPSAQAQLLLERSWLKNLIPHERIVLREAVVNPKPAPDVFLETARRMGIDPRGQLVFDDSPNGIRAALAAGSTPVAMPVYRRKETLTALVEAGAIRMFVDWRELNILKLIANIGEEVAR